jgi:hypothetical protein
MDPRIAIWRFKNPKSNYYHSNDKGTHHLFCKTKYKLISVQVGSFEHESFPAEKLGKSQTPGLIL